MIKHRLAHIASLVMQMSYPGWTFEAIEEDGRMYLRVGDPNGTCTETGKPLAWVGRKWRLSSHMTDSEVVQTGLKAVLTALEHEARESFRFRGVAVYGPHIDVYALLEVAQRVDARDLPK